jgi:hypothetical protein
MGRLHESSSRKARGDLFFEAFRSYRTVFSTPVRRSFLRRSRTPASPYGHSLLSPWPGISSALRYTARRWWRGPVGVDPNSPRKRCFRISGRPATWASVGIMAKDSAPTSVRRALINRSGDEKESCNVSNYSDRLRGSCRYNPPSTTSSVSNAISSAEKLSTNCVQRPSKCGRVRSRWHERHAHVEPERPVKVNVSLLRGGVPLNDDL